MPYYDNLVDLLLQYQYFAHGIQAAYNGSATGEEGDALQSICKELIRLRRLIDEHLLEERSNEDEVMKYLEDSVGSLKMYADVAKGLTGTSAISLDEMKGRRKSLLLQEKRILLDQIQLAKVNSIHFTPDATCQFRMYNLFYGPQYTGRCAYSLSQKIPDSHTQYSWMGDFKKSVPSHGHTNYSWTSREDETVEKILSLLQIISFLRRLEASKTFQKNLLRDQLVLSQDLTYTRTNYAYGSTPYSTFVLVFRNPTIQQAIKDWNSKNTAVVFGSSIGTIAFYISLSLGISCKGYEILPYLYSISQEIIDRYDVKGVEFICEDMMTADLQDCALVFLTSQCWDRKLCSAVYEKLAKEIHEGCVVVDYADHLGRYAGFSTGTTVEGKVSWNDFHVFHIYKRISILS